MDAPAPIRTFVLSDTMTNSRTAWKFLRSEGIGPYAVIDMTATMWNLSSHAYGARSYFGWLLTGFREIGGTFGGKSVNEIADILARTCVQESVSLERDTVGAVFVHEDTIESLGFWPLVHAIRDQQRRHSFDELAVYTHSGDSSPSLLVEHPVLVS